MLVFGDLVWIPFTFSIQASDCELDIYVKELCLSLVALQSMFFGQLLKLKMKCNISIFMDD
jgi:hypothetical protein